MSTTASPRRIAVRRSPIHGRGVFALRAIGAGERIAEYRGEVLTWRAAQARYDAVGVDGHTYFMDRGDGRVIDGGVGGNSTRYLNHSCDPNCEAVIDGTRVYIHAIADIPAGAELLLDYQLHVDDATEQDRAAYACRCAARTCRRTILAT